jgi:glycosyltransferase involved in cell wall biosynthesis
LRANVVHVRHQWPPNFTPPPAGHWVIYQPWEYGSLPVQWIDPISHLVDQVWVPTRFVRDSFLRSGIAGDVVSIIPYGVDIHRFNPRATPLKLKTNKRFKFLFVGGTIARKGIDLLLDTYARLFTNADDVCLVIQDMGSRTFYRGQTASARIAQMQATRNSPEIEYRERPLSAEEIAGLYSACDCLVHPYRGEGFGLPIAEAMATGLPVVVTGYGAALDFCNADNAFLIPAQEVHFPDKRIGDMQTVDRRWLAQPDLEALKHLLRYVIEHPSEARSKGKVACAHIRSRFTWDHAVDAVEARLQELRQKPIRRLRSPADSHRPHVVGYIGTKPPRPHEGNTKAVPVPNPTSER